MVWLMTPGTEEIVFILELPFGMIIIMVVGRVGVIVGRGINTGGSQQLCLKPLKFEVQISLSFVSPQYEKPE